MSLRLVKPASWAVLSGAAWLALAASSAQAQFFRFQIKRDNNCCPPECLSAPVQLGPAQPYPQAPTQPTQPGQTQPTQPTSPEQLQAPQAQLPSEMAAAAGGESFAAATSNGGYIDQAIPRSQLRLRYDMAYDNNRPDRAEFFYAKCGCFPDGPGPRVPVNSLDFQELYVYGEYAISDRFSAFLDVPFRWVNPDTSPTTGGLSDIQFGTKFALIADPCQFLTFQLKAFTPTGDADRGLGTYHYSLEPGLLLWRRLSDRLVFEAELRDWIPIAGTDFQGNVLRYGAGLSYDVWRSCGRRITPVAELVGWTVLNGKQFAFNEGGQTFDAGGDTIINAKLGVRFGLGDHSSLYVGYGRALTGEVWYKDMFRAEYRLSF